MRRLLNGFRVALRRVFGGRDRDPRLPSFVRAMLDLSSKATVREVVSSCSDRRQWGILTAAWIGVSEKEFARAAAEKLKIVYRERIPLIDESTVIDDLETMLPACRESGVVPIFEGEKIVEFVVVDPAEVRGAPRFDGSQRISLGCWSEISRVLDDAQRSLAEKRSEQSREQSVRATELCRRVVDLIVSEASRYGCVDAEVVTINGETRYQFLTADGQRGYGRIHNSVVDDLITYLSKAHESGLRTRAEQDVVVRPLGNHTNFKLSWGSAVLSLPTPGDRSGVLSASRKSLLITEAGTQTSVNSPSKEAFERELNSSTNGQTPILVVDDNPMFCRVLERLLQRDGYAPCFENDGAAALKRLQNANEYVPAAIICDLHMPVMNGREFLGRVRTDVRFKGIPILMLTSDEDVEAELSLIQSGADAFVSKAKDPRVLCAQIKRLIGDKPIRRAA